MNRETQRILAHRLLIDAEVFRDREFGAVDCRVCAGAVLARAGEVAKFIAAEEDPKIEEYRVPNIRDVWWDTDGDIVGDFSRAVRIAHSRHAGN